MNGNDIEQAVEILKEKIPLNMKNHVKKNSYIWLMCKGRLYREFRY